MQIITDLQLHSKYSRAVSPQMMVLQIWEWARRKGIGLVATGDWTHPLWMREIRMNLEETGNGLLKLKKENIPFSLQDQDIDTDDGPFFLLATEISSIYSQGGKLRRIHTLVWAPSFASADKINKALLDRGCNLISDGRPIIGLSSINVAELVFSADPSCLVIPAHAWTPWFSLYGSESGFDSIDECFGQFAKNIYAIETGLSSDPAMNWRIKELDNRSILSFSDAHSGPKLGREATVFELNELSYKAIREAIIQPSVVSNQLSVASNKPPDKQTADNRPASPKLQRGEQLKTDNRIAYTIEFHPEEGKYHFTGHRNCGIKQTLEETRKKGTVCPVCGKKLTVGVMHRVDQLAGRTEEELQLSVISIQLSEGGPEIKMTRTLAFPSRPPYVMLVPLQEILAESLSSMPASQKVQDEYKKLTDHFGSEFTVLLQTKLEDIEKFSGPKVAEAIGKVRTGDIVVDPGYDGIFGVVKIWPKEGEEKKEEKPKEQLSLF